MAIAHNRQGPAPDSRFCDEPQSGRASGSPPERTVAVFAKKKGNDGPEAHVVSLLVLKLRPMILTYRYRLLPTRQQHRALEAILESQRQIYNAALQERRDAYRLSGVTRTYIDQCKGLTELRQDAEFSGLPVRLQRATLKRLEEAYRGFFRRAKNGEKPGFPRFRGKGWFNSFGFREFEGISFQARRIRFKGMPGSLRVHLHRPLPAEAVIKSCTFRREAKDGTSASP